MPIARTHLEKCDGSTSWWGTTRGPTHLLTPQTGRGPQNTFHSRSTSSHIAQYVFLLVVQSSSQPTLGDPPPRPNCRSTPDLSTQCTSVAPEAGSSVTSARLVKIALLAKKKPIDLSTGVAVPTQLLQLVRQIQGSN